MPLRFPRLWYGNFDFERELTGRGGTMPADAERTTILSAGWLAIAEEGDWIATPLLWPAEFWENLALQCPSLPRIENVCWAEVTRQATHQLAPWGWSAAAARWGAAHGLKGNGPPAEIVRYANSRTFSISCEATAHCGLARATTCCL